MTSLLVSCPACHEAYVSALQASPREKLKVMRNAGDPLLVGSNKGELPSVGEPCDPCNDSVQLSNRPGMPTADFCAMTVD